LRDAGEDLSAAREVSDEADDGHRRAMSAGVSAALHGSPPDTGRRT
jgi:hypothetical protein